MSELLSCFGSLPLSLSLSLSSATKLSSLVALNWMMDVYVFCFVAGFPYLRPRAPSLPLHRALLRRCNKTSLIKLSAFIVSPSFTLLVDEEVSRLWMMDRWIGR